MRKPKKTQKQFLGAKWRVCACGKKYAYAGKGRPFKRCPRCRKESP